MNIKTNNQPRDIIHHYELTDKEKKELDYIDWDTEGDDFTGFRYKGQIYDLGEFVRIIPQGQTGGPFAHYDHNGTLKGWQGIATDSFFSGTLVRYTPDLDGVIVGWFCC